MRSACFITWIEHRRTRELSRKLGFELVELVSEKRGLRRYLELIPRTFWFLRSRRPSALVVQTPSIVLSGITLLLRPWIGYRLLLDAHNEAVAPHIHQSWPILALTYCLTRMADRVIVTNHQLAEIVVSRQGTPIILTDPVPTYQGEARGRLSDKFSAVIVSTFAGDEPIDALFAAALEAGEEFRFFVTGNADRLPKDRLQKVPPNVALTGFLSDADYWSLLASADAVIDLTTMDSCLVCGAYEAIAVGTPLVLSNNAASVDTFSGFAEFTDNSPRDIVLALKRVRARHTEMSMAIPRLRAELDGRWMAQSRVLLDFIASCAPGHSQ